MKRLDRLSTIVDSHHSIPIFILVTAHLLMAWTALGGSTIGIVGLACSATFWGIFAQFNTRRWGKSVGYLEEAAHNMSVMGDVNLDLASLLEEALIDLKDYDREKADDLVYRTNTIMALRRQNLKGLDE